MKAVVIGVSHATAPAALLERLALDPAAADKLAQDVAGVLGGPDQPGSPGEAVVLSTCNRIEIYAAADVFHRTVADVSELFSRHTGVAVDEISPHLQVLWDRAARAHVFAVAAGLESVVQGEPQILGQVRAALRRSQDSGTVGPTLNAVLQHALRTGKRVQAQTRVGEAGRSLLSVALDLAGDVGGSTAVVLGAGSLARLALSELTRRDARDLVVANRTLGRAVAAAGDSGARAVALGDRAALRTALAAADLVVSCTGAAHAVLSLATVREALALREPGRDLVVLDLALPHDVEPAVGALPGVRIVDLGSVAASGRGLARTEDLAAAAEIVAEEVAASDGALLAADAVPAVVALRALAADVVDRELDRLRARTPGLEPGERAEVERAVHRVVDKLLHRPSVRVRELAAEAAGPDYADALRQLFALDPGAVSAVTGDEAP
jgi:glutamyl-tRNA reductase